MAICDPLISLNEVHQTEPMSEWSYSSKRTPRGNFSFPRGRKARELNQSLRIPQQKGGFPILKTVVTQGTENGIFMST